MLHCSTLVWLKKIGETVVSHAGTSENGLMLAIMVVTATMSAFLSNTGTTAALLPVVVGICAVAKIPASRQLMPLAFAAGIGGIITIGWYTSKHYRKWYIN